ncbi:RDD family protein [Nocardioides mangrovicus]|uniref:RDD family protein n=1 Tax=Nocardioides mangrovicus TaxID=2478913 RepID=A0A3L8P3J9_9ACTN|nr:RDD family protein [Nocardioides mangrovicus]RLV49109.1 RDD family protein [Nocardioides mangrovicus]
MQTTASWGRRILALLVDWAGCSLVTLLFVGPDHWFDTSTNWIVLGVFWVESAVGTALAGGSFGQLATRLRVLHTNGRRVPLLPALARQLLVCLVIPPLVFKPDGRGLHDLAARTGTYRLSELPD